MYRPLTLTSYAVNYHFGGYDVGGYRLVNLILHVGSALATFALVLQLSGQRRLAFGAAMLFAVHPVVSEPVNYISARAGSLAAFFSVSAVWLYCRCNARFTASYALSLSCFVLALMSKSTAIITPVILVALSVHVSGRHGKRLWWRGQILFWSVAFVYLVGMRGLIGEALVQAPVRDMVTQLSTQVKALGYYVLLAAVPRGLHVDHQFNVASGPVDPVVISAVAMVFSLAYVTWKCVQANLRWPAFWLVWCAVSLAPTFVVPLNVLASERRLYLCLIGAAALISWVLSKSGSRSRRLFPGLIVAMALLAFERNQVWASERSLWLEAASKSPLAVRPHVRLGTTYIKGGLLEAALKEYELALEIDPNSAPALNNMGNLYRRGGDFPAAERSYRAALKILPRYPEALINLGALYNASGRTSDALGLFERAGRLVPERPELLNNLGITYLNLERYADALAVLERALETEPSSARIHFNLGGALEGLGRDADAVSSYERAAESRAGYAKPHYRLSVLYAKLGNPELAQKARRRYNMLTAIEGNGSP